MDDLKFYTGQVRYYERQTRWYQRGLSNSRKMLAWSKRNLKRAQAGKPSLSWRAFIRSAKRAKGSK